MEFVDLLGVRFASLTETQTAAWVLERSGAGEGGWVLTPNTHRLKSIITDPEMRALAASASLTVADGMPLVWASALQGTPLPERVAGSSLVWSLARAAAAGGASLFLLGGDAGVAERAADRLRAEIPGIAVVGCHCPPYGFEHDEREVSLIHEQLRAANPDIVYVGLGILKEERLITELCRAFPQTWFLGIGISLSFISGDQARAPRWVQRWGLEWCHRLVREPTRLFRRYLVEGVPFTLRLLVSAGAARRRRR